MIFFGIDPGSVITGYGVVCSEHNKISWIDSGVIKTDDNDGLPGKLEQIYNSLVDKITFHKPDRVCVENAFFAKNIHTTLILGHARGVAILAGKKSGATVSEYTPREIKKSVAGNGNAAKEQVEYMVRMILSPPITHTQADAYDALAIALCDCYCYKSRELMSQQPKTGRTGKHTNRNTWR